MFDLFEEIRKYEIVSIIGLAKNVSKTTTLNHVIKHFKGKLTLGLTSIGRDGEAYDVITQLPKPKIHVEKGTIIATAEQCYENSSVETQLIKTTSIHTPMGYVTISKALNGGYIELAGPSINSYVREVTMELKELGCDIVLIDGAFDRKSFATPMISDATILSTGASVSESLEKVVKITAHTIDLFSLESIKDGIVKDLVVKIFEKSKVGLITKSNTVKLISVSTALGAQDIISSNLSNDTKYIVIEGAITDQLLETLTQKTNLKDKITLIGEDATKLFISEKVLRNFRMKGFDIKIMHPIKMIAVTINPTSPLGYEFDKELFMSRLMDEIGLPIYDLGPCE